MRWRGRIDEGERKERGRRERGSTLGENVRGGFERSHHHTEAMRWRGRRDERERGMRGRVVGDLGEDVGREFEVGLVLSLLVVAKIGCYQIVKHHRYSPEGEVRRDETCGP